MKQKYGKWRRYAESYAWKDVDLKEVRMFLDKKGVNPDEIEIHERYVRFPENLLPEILPVIEKFYPHMYPKGVGLFLKYSSIPAGILLASYFVYEIIEKFK